LRGCSYPDDPPNGGNSSSGGGGWYIFEDFTGIGTPTGWTYSGFERRTADGVDGSTCLGGRFYYSNETTASVTTSLVAMSANPLLSFKYRATVPNYNGPTSTTAANGAVLYNIYISADNGATWTNVLTDVSHVSSADFETITVNLPATYAKQVIRTRITFARVTDAYVLLDDVAMN